MLYIARKDMYMPLTNELFEKMDAWRHLPNYQLERRADLLFSLYLPEVLEEELGFQVMNDLVPEFPVHIGTIYPKIDTNKSFKIDYLALSQKADRAVLVELKTDGNSRRPEQDKYLNAAKEVGLKELLGGLLEIFRATSSKHKYFCLLQLLSKMGLLSIPEEMENLFKQHRLQGVTELSHEIEISCHTEEPIVVYIQPNRHTYEQGKIIISFDDFRAVVERHDDQISKRFAQSLKEWSQVTAGHI
jgi:hypothetical protein